MFFLKKMYLLSIIHLFNNNKNNNNNTFFVKGAFHSAQGHRTVKKNNIKCIIYKTYSKHNIKSNIYPSIGYFGVSFEDINCREVFFNLKQFLKSNRTSFKFHVGNIFSIPNMVSLYSLKTVRDSYSSQSGSLNINVILLN